MSALVAPEKSTALPNRSRLLHQVANQLSVWVLGWVAKAQRAPIGLEDIIADQGPLRVLSQDQTSVLPGHRNGQWLGADMPSSGTEMPGINDFLRSPSSARAELHSGVVMSAEAASTVVRHPLVPHQ